MVADLRLTPTEKRLLDVLNDGMPKCKALLLPCLPVGDSCSLHYHLSNLRGKLADVGMNIVSVRGEWMLMQRIQRFDD